MSSFCLPNSFIFEKLNLAWQTLQKQIEQERKNLQMQ